MWLMTKYGFFSIVLKEEGLFHVRARVKQDLENLVREVPLPGVEVSSRSGPDYAHRLILPQEDLLKILIFLGQNLDYGNFKSTIGASRDQRHKSDAYHDIWGVLARDFGAYGQEGRVSPSDEYETPARP